MKCFYMVCVFVGVIGWIMNGLYSTWLPKNYIFDPQTLSEISNRVIASQKGNTTEGLLRSMRDELANHYGPQFINEYKDEDWVFNNAGGAMGQMIILHASISEYVILFGSAVGTEGHTGVHFADDYFTILKGQQTAASAHLTEPEIYEPGMTHHLVKGTPKQYSMPQGSFALELAQGWIPCMLPFGFLDTFTSTLDVINLYRTVYLTGRDMIKNLVQNQKF
ncbi:hypothetical protein ZYGR_0I02280 [Zygosaccharomyces rouxii]|uniref:C-8 sterol isomerase n=2 Tax=Zygosaccharomyces rouxii TaxID=4956 RepID=C5DT47_ZYGRC|nr:uncharacterized protein ZYRO0C05434g [Zygosaccharomyces rouxii]KAH9201856.1 ERG2/sigma1 receptor-like protein [Zygosaccharomyces rouxii]GAV47932.1 hypothetical protein ZYGR_0I02280 [Zygosaccharomyces rouxii]CAR26958.1 ZYRO0C05434p [Zygosaccharomyces rouxii]